MELYTGVRELQIRPEIIDQFYQDKILRLDPEVRVFDKRLSFKSQNEYILLQSLHTNQSAIARVRKDNLVLVNNGKDIEVAGVRPRNLHQRMTLDALLDDQIQVVVLTGKAGTGKTILAMAMALQKMESKRYNRLILTKPMSQVGDKKRPLGILPGEIDEKFNPYLDNFMDNIEHLLNGKYKNVRDLISQYRMEFKPLQLIRGASWKDTLIIADELQVLDHHEMVTLGTRIGEGSKLVIMGDLGQRDEKIAVERTGMYKLVNDKKFQESEIAASVELEQCERGPVAAIFAEIFGV